MDKEFYSILQKMFLDGDFKRVIRSFNFHNNPELDKELKKDFEQDLIITLCTHKNKEKIVEMYNRGKNELMRFMITVTKNNIYSNTSPYYYKYGRYERSKNDLGMIDED